VDKLALGSWDRLLGAESRPRRRRRRRRRISHAIRRSRRQRKGPSTSHSAAAAAAAIVVVVVRICPVGSDRSAYGTGRDDAVHPLGLSRTGSRRRRFAAAAAANAAVNVYARRLYRNLRRVVKPEFNGNSFLVACHEETAPVEFSLYRVVGLSCQSIVWFF